MTHDELAALVAGSIELPHKLAMELRRRHDAQVEGYLQTLVDAGIPLTRIRVGKTTWALDDDRVTLRPTTIVTVLPESIEGTLTL